MKFNEKSCLYKFLGLTQSHACPFDDPLQRFV